MFAILLIDIVIIGYAVSMLVTLLVGNNILSRFLKVILIPTTILIYFSMGSETNSELIDVILYLAPIGITIIISIIAYILGFAEKKV